MFLRFPGILQQIQKKRSDEIGLHEADPFFAAAGKRNALFFKGRVQIPGDVVCKRRERYGFQHRFAAVGDKNIQQFEGKPFEPLPFGEDIKFAASVCSFGVSD